MHIAEQRGSPLSGKERRVVGSSEDSAFASKKAYHYARSRDTHSSLSDRPQIRHPFRSPLGPTCPHGALCPNEALRGS